MTYYVCVFTGAEKGVHMAGLLHEFSRTLCSFSFDFTLQELEK